MRINTNKININVGVKFKRGGYKIWAPQRGIIALKPPLLNFSAIVIISTRIVYNQYGAIGINHVSLMYIKIFGEMSAVI